MSKVILTSDGENVEFSVEQAQRMLDYQKQNNLSSWKLNDKKYNLDENGVIIRANSKLNKKAEEQPLD